MQSHALTECLSNWRTSKYLPKSLHYFKISLELWAFTFLDILINNYYQIQYLHGYELVSYSVRNSENQLMKLRIYSLCLSLFSYQIMSESLWPHILQHASPTCSSLFPRVCSNSFPLSWWCHPTISSSVIPSPFSFNLYQHQGLF